MWTLISLAVGGLLLYNLYSSVRGLRRNLAAAKASGIPYKIIPLWYQNPLWIAFGPRIVKLLERFLPQSWQGYWLRHIFPTQTWRWKYATFAKLGSDMVIFVSPRWNWLLVADADAAAQIIQRRTDFPKPTHNYKSLDIYGKNVVSTEGSYWRHHRRIVAPPFNEQNNHLVWDESLHQVQSMMHAWTGPDGNKSVPIKSVAPDAMRLSLYVISKAGFGRSMEWPGIDDGRAAYDDSARTKEEETGHSMTYTAALNTLLRNPGLLVAFPKPVLRWSPSKRFRDVYQAYIEWGKYMVDIYNTKQHELRSTDQHTGLDLMGGLIRAAGSTEKGADPLLSREEIMGNAFIMMLAGHETTANSIHFSLILLAMNIAAQRRAQSELDQIFGERPVSRWSYEDDLPRLFGGMLGAVMAEQLRVVPPVMEIPKWCTTPQPLTVGDKHYTIPATTHIGLCVVAAHRNPRFWPHGPPRDPSDPEHPLSNLDNDLEEFKPERWLPATYAGPGADPPASKGTMGAATAAAERTAETDELGVNTAADTAASLYKPVKGSYLPFSEGYRSCLGRRFAQVEFLAVMAVILKTWSVELAVDQWASDAEVDRMMPPERRDVWEKARRSGRDILNQHMVAKITLQLRPGVSVPLRFVKRGKERFDWRD